MIKVILKIRVVYFHISEIDTCFAKLNLIDFLVHILPFNLHPAKLEIFKANFVSLIFYFIE